MKWPVYEPRDKVSAKSQQVWIARPWILIGQGEIGLTWDRKLVYKDFASIDSC